MEKVFAVGISAPMFVENNLMETKNEMRNRDRVRRNHPDPWISLHDTHKYIDEESDLRVNFRNDKCMGREWKPHTIYIIY